MPPILFKNLSGGTIENVARNNVISSNIARNNVISNNTENINNSKKLHRRQDDTKPTPVDSISTVTISPGPITFTFTIPVPTDIIPKNITSIPTNTNPTATDTPDTPNTPDTPDTDTNPTDINSTSATATATVTPTVISTPTNTDVFTTSTGAISSSEIIPTKISTPISSGIPKEPTQTSPSSPSISLLSPPPVSVPSNNASNNASNNFHAWLFPILAILLLIIILAFLGFIYKKRKRNTSTDNLLRDVDDEDKDKEHDSKTNSLTSSINSVSSFRIKRGKVAPEDFYTGSPPALIAPIVSNDNDEEELKRPVIKRTPTTVSVFTEMVNLTEEENNSLRLSIASRQSSTPSYVQYVNYHNVGESSPSIAAIPLHQERIDAVIPFSIANEGGGGSASASGSGIRTFATSPFDSINNDNDDND